MMNEQESIMEKRKRIREKEKKGTRRIILGEEKDEDYQEKRLHCRERESVPSKDQTDGVGEQGQD